MRFLCTTYTAVCCCALHFLRLVCFLPVWVHTCRGGNWKRKSSHFFCTTTTYPSASSQTFSLFVKPSVAQFLSFLSDCCGFMFSPLTLTSVAQSGGSQGRRELDYSVIQLYFHPSCIKVVIGGALDHTEKQVHVYSANFATSGHLG